MMETIVLCITALFLYTLVRFRDNLVSSICYAAACNASDPCVGASAWKKRARQHFPPAAKRINDADSGHPIKAFGG